MSIGKLNNVSFTASPGKFGPEVETFVRRKQLQKDLLKSMPKSMGILNKLNSLSGEVPNIIINALGTAFVAPIFIKYNFLSKTDEDTRTYSAWRQPISAALAVVTQAGLVIPFDRAIEMSSNTGRHTDAKYNKTMLQDEGYIKRSIQKEYKKANNGAKISEEELKTAVLEEQKNQIEKLATSLKEKNTIEYIENGQIKHMDDAKVKELLHGTVDDLISDADANLNRSFEEKTHFKV